MDILYLLIPLSLVLLALVVWAFFWAVRSGQFDDLEGPAHRILMDTDPAPADNEQKANAKNQNEKPGPDGINQMKP